MSSNGLSAAYAGAYLQDVRQDSSNNIILKVLKKLDELAGDTNLSGEHEKELSISTAAAHQAKRTELENKFQTYPPDHKTQADVKAEYETDFQQKYDNAVAAFQANPAHSFIPPREVSELFAFDGMKTYGWNTTLEDGKGNIDRENVLKYDKEIHLTDFDHKIYQLPYSKNIDVYGSLHNFLDFGKQIGLNKAQLGELIKQFVKEHFPNRYPGIRNTTNVQELFTLALDLVNWNDMALKAKQAIKAIERRPKDSLSSVVHTFSTLRKELFEYTNPAWDDKKIEERAEIATLGILQDLVSRDTAEFLQSVKAQARLARMEVSLTEQVSLLTKQELKPGFALEKTKSLAHYDPNISRELDSSSKIESVLNHVVAMADTRLEDGVRRSGRTTKGKPAKRFEPGDPRKGRGTGTKPKTATRSSRAEQRSTRDRDSSPTPRSSSASPAPIREKTRRSPSTVRHRSTSPESSGTSAATTRSPSPAPQRRRQQTHKGGNRNKDKAHRPGAGSSRKQAPTKTPRTQPAAVPRPPSPQHGLSSTEHSGSNPSTPSHSRPSSSERRACYLCGQASHGWRHCNIYRNYTQTEERPCEVCGKGFHKPAHCAESKKYRAKVSKSVSGKK